MATDLQPRAPGGTPTEKPKVFGLFSMVLFSVSAILVADTVGSSAAMGVQRFVTAELGSAWPVFFPAEGVSKGVFWLITGGGTIVSLLIGWWLYRHAGHKPGGRAEAETVDA